MRMDFPVQVAENVSTFIRWGDVQYVMLRHWMIFVSMITVNTIIDARESDSKCHILQIRNGGDGYGY